MLQWFDLEDHNNSYLMKQIGCHTSTCGYYIINTVIMAIRINDGRLFFCLSDWLFQFFFVGAYCRIQDSKGNVKGGGGKDGKDVSKKYV